MTADPPTADPAAIPDGLALVAALRETHTPPHLLRPALAFLEAHPFADAAATHAALAAHPDTPEGTVVKSESLLRTGRPPLAEASADPLDKIRELRGETVVRQPTDPGAADRAAAKAAAAERDAERARAEAILARLEEADARAAADRHRLEAAEAKATADRARIAELESLMEQATAPAAPTPAEA